MTSVDLAEEERVTAHALSTNPFSGEWIKGMCMVLAEMGMVSYLGKAPRTLDIFEGIGNKENRRKYLLHRIAFTRAVFQLHGVTELTVYRCAGEGQQWTQIEKTFMYSTLNNDVAENFCWSEQISGTVNRPLKKLRKSPKDVFMTFLETEAFNQQGEEAEVILFHSSMHI